MPFPAFELHVRVVFMRYSIFSVYLLAKLVNAQLLIMLPLFLLAFILTCSFGSFVRHERDK